MSKNCFINDFLFCCTAGEAGAAAAEAAGTEEGGR